MHPAMKIYAHGTVRKPGTSGDFRSSHAFDKTQDQWLAIGVRQPAYCIQQRDAVFDSDFAFRILRRFGYSSLIVERTIRLRATVKICRAVTCDSRQPWAETRNIAKCCKLWQGLQENVVDQILGGCAGNSRE